MAGKIIDSSVRGVRYTISLPERVIRSLTALLGGVLKESTDFLIPDALKESTTYRIFIGNLLRYGVENIGRVHGVYEEEGTMDNDYGVKKVVGNGIELVGVVAVSASPLWVLAFFSDALWGVDKYFKRIADELDRDDLIEEKIRFERRGDLLQSFVKVSDSLAKNVDTPPLTKAEIKENFDELREYFREVGEKAKISLDDIEGMWMKIENAARDSNRSIYEISGAVTIHTMNRVRSMRKTLRASGKVGSDIIHEDILDYYRSALDDIADRGYATVIKEEFSPYLKRSWEMFSPDEKMLTERIFSRELLDHFGEWREKRGQKSRERKMEKEKIAKRRHMGSEETNGAEEGRKAQGEEEMMRGNEKEGDTEGEGKQGEKREREKRTGKETDGDLEGGEKAKEETRTEKENEGDAEGEEKDSPSTVDEGVELSI